MFWPSPLLRVVFSLALVAAWAGGMAFLSGMAAAIFSLLIIPIGAFALYSLLGGSDAPNF